MMKKELVNKLNPLFTKNNALIAMAIVIVLLIFFRGEKKVEVKVPAVPTKQIEKQLVKDTLAIKKAVDSMKQRENKWKDSIRAVNSNLETAEQLVVELLNDATVIIDSSNKEELHQQLQYLKAAVKVKDSLCNTSIYLRDSLIVNLEGQMSQKDSLASALRSSYSSVVQNEQLKDKTIKDLNKQIRKQKVKKQGWKIGAAAAGIIILANSLK